MEGGESWMLIIADDRLIGAIALKDRLNIDVKDLVLTLFVSLELSLANYLC
jgi:hypothetical protein